MLHPKIQHIVDVYGKLPETLDEVAESVIAVVSQTDPVVGFAWDINYNPKCSNTHYAPHNGKTNWGGHVKGAPRNYPGFYGRFWIRYAEETKDVFGSTGNLRKSLTHTGSGGGGSYNGPWVEICTAAFQAGRSGLPQKDDLFALPIPTTKCFSTDYTIFLADHPGLDIESAIAAHNLQQDKDEIWHAVSGTRWTRQQFQLNHKFQWEDPATKAADEEFIENFKKLHQVEPV